MYIYIIQNAIHTEGNSADQTNNIFIFSSVFLQSDTYYLIDFIYLALL